MKTRRTRRGGWKLFGPPKPKPMSYEQEQLENAKNAEKRLNAIPGSKEPKGTPFDPIAERNAQLKNLAATKAAQKPTGKGRRTRKPKMTRKH